MGRPNKARQIVGLFGAIAVMTTGFLRPVRSMVKIPQVIMVPSGQRITLPWSSWVTVTSPVGERVSVKPGFVHVGGLNPGHFVIRTKLFGWIPWRSFPVEVIKPVYEVPGGESIGVVVNTRGLVVRGYAPVSVGGHFVDPAKEAGIDKGDVIVKANHRLVTSNRVLQEAIQQSGRRHKPVALGVQGARRYHWRYVKPVWSPVLRTWHIGVMVQGGASGVGTLTFYNPESLKYAALGHSITDGVTPSPIAINGGRVTGARIVGIIASRSDGPGQKIGVLASGKNVQGTVVANSFFGITGRLTHQPIWGAHHALPVALPDQVHPGPAQIVTVLHDQKTQLFSIRIIKTYPQWHAHTKGLLFEVDDPHLLRQTGGIVQGMSGSPIIQDGKLVGAVTHVLLSRPNLGYGCYAYWMAMQKSFS